MTELCRLDEEKRLKQEACAILRRILGIHETDLESVTVTVDRRQPPSVKYVYLEERPGVGKVEHQVSWSVPCQANVDRWIEDHYGRFVERVRLAWRRGSRLTTIEIANITYMVDAGTFAVWRDFLTGLFPQTVRADTR